MKMWSLLEIVCMDKKQKLEIIEYLDCNRHLMEKLGRIALQHHLPFDSIKCKYSFIKYRAINQKAKNGEVYKEALQIDENLQASRIVFSVGGLWGETETLCNQEVLWKMLYDTIPNLMKSEANTKYDREYKKRRR